MYKITICDDFFDDLTKIKNIVDDYFKKEHFENIVNIYNSATELIQEITCNNSNRSDIYILDIIMPNMSGMELAESIRKTDKNCAIIFVTISMDYAVKGYKVRALDYIMKPIEKIEVENALKTAIAKITGTGTIVAKIKNNAGYKLIELSKLLYAETKGHDVRFTFIDGTIEDVTGRLDDFSLQLLKYNFLMRCHKSFIINLNYIGEIRNKQISMKNNRLINISRSFQPFCKDKYHDFIIEKINGNDGY